MKEPSTFMISHACSGWVNQITRLVYLEQSRQAGTLIEQVSLEGFIVKMTRDADFIVFCQDMKVRGFAAYYTYDQSLEQSFITLFLVSPEARGKGVAKRLLREVAADSLDKGFEFVSLHVRRDNFRAIRFYQSNEFVLVGEQGNQLHLKASARHLVAKDPLGM